MSLRETLRSDLTAAMKAGDTLTRDVLRLVLAAVAEAETAGESRSELDDSGIESIMKKKAKDYADTAEIYRSKGEDERAAAEDAERSVVERYLPDDLSDDELAALVDAALVDGGFSGPSQMGPAMKAAMATVAGRADGKRVSALVKSRLT